MRGVKTGSVTRLLASVATACGGAQASVHSVSGPASSARIPSPAQGSAKAGGLVVLPADAVTAPTFGVSFVAQLPPGLKGRVAWTLDEGPVAGTVDRSGHYMPSTTHGTYHVRAMVHDASGRALASGVAAVKNGLIQAVTVAPLLTIHQAGTYRVSLALGASNGKTVQKGVEISLDPGLQRVPFTFTAEEVRRLGSPGPYTLKDLKIDLEKDGNIFPMGEVPALGTLPVTDLSLFQRPWVVFTGSFVPRGIDTDGDGLLDELEVKVGVRVLASGTFDVGATLVDRNGEDITTNAVNQQTLAPGAGVITLRFSGADIKAHGVEGPFTVSDLEVYDRDQAGTEDTAGTIQGFPLSRFDAGATPAPPSPAGPSGRAR